MVCRLLAGIRLSARYCSRVFQVLPGFQALRYLGLLQRSSHTFKRAEFTMFIINRRVSTSPTLETATETKHSSFISTTSKAMSALCFQTTSPETLNLSGHVREIRLSTAQL